MAFKRIVANSEEDLKNIINDIMNWFKETKNYKTSFTKEKRKFQNPETKEIIEKEIDVLKVVDNVNGKSASIKFIPMKEKGEVKIELGGEGETVIAGKISNQMKGRGKLKNYSKDKKVALEESIKEKEISESIMTRSQLKEIIKSEIRSLLNENEENGSITIEGISATGKGYTVWKGSNPIGDLRQKISSYPKNDFGKITVNGKPFDFYYVTQIKTDKFPYIKSIKDHVGRAAYFTVSAPQGSVSKEDLKATAENILEKNKNQDGITKW